jgi:hypothetical protein
LIKQRTVEAFAAIAFNAETKLLLAACIAKAIGYNEKMVG